MKATTLKKAAVYAGSLSFLAGSVFAQTAVSGAGGYRTETIEQGFNVVGVNLHNPVIVSGSLDTSNGAEVGDSTVDYGAILSADETYIFEVLDGDQAGAIAEISAAGNGSVTLDGDIGDINGAAYSIRKAPTLNETFGGLTAGFTAAGADVVWVPTGEAAPNNFAQYFKHSTGNFRAAGSFSDPAKPISFLYSDAVLIERKAADPLPIVITGMVKTVGTVVNIPEGFGPVAVSAPVGSTLQDSGLAAVLTPGFTAAGADVIWVPNGPQEANAFNQYFVHTTGGIRAAGSFADADPVSVNNGLLIERKSEGTAGLLTVPDFYANL